MILIDTFSNGSINYFIFMFSVFAASEAVGTQYTRWITATVTAKIRWLTGLEDFAT